MPQARLKPAPEPQSAGFSVSRYGADTPFFYEDYPGIFQLMKTNCRKKPLTFGEFIACVYADWGRRKARGIVRLAIKAHLIEFRGQQRFVIS